MTRKIADRPLDIAGRRPKQPPRDAAEKIEALAEEGWSELGIAKRLGTSADTLRRWLEEYELMA
jgi:transposase